MYEFSEKNNREMGVYVLKDKDNELYTKAVNETNSIIRSSEPIELTKKKRHFHSHSHEDKNKRSKPNRGYCIRCEDRIDYNPERPYCWSCYSTWAQFENPDYQENVCHRCGEFESTSMNFPQCRECWEDFRKEGILG